MSVKNVIFIIIILILTNLLSGCALFQNTEFELISLNIVDEDGFTIAKIDFNISNTATIRVIKPNGIVHFSEEYYKGVHTAFAYLDEYRQTPALGNYKIKAVDKNDNTIFEDDLTFLVSNITIDDIVEYWWLEEDKHSLVGLKISLRNNGDLPIYPNKLDVGINNKASSWFFLPTVIMPSQIEDVYCCLYINDIPIGNNDITINIRNSKEEIIAKKSYVVNPLENTNELKFQWRYMGSREFGLPDVEFLYEYYHGLERLDTSDYAAYDFSKYDDHLIDLLAYKFQSIYSSSGDVATINFIASFVQNIAYVEDTTDCDYPRYPIETLKDRQGDCEDKAILTASILNSLGYNVSLIQLPKHVAVGVNLDESATTDDYFVDEYYYLETTSTGWLLGKIPPEHLGKTNITIYTLNPRPLLIHSWKNATRYTDSEGSDYIKMKIIVENLGTKYSGNFIIEASFFDLNGNIVNQETTSVTSLPAGQKKIVEMSIDVPQGVTTKLKSLIYLNNKMVHKRESLSNFP